MQEKISNLVELLQSRAVHRPEKKIYTFLLGDDGETREFTSGMLDERARTIAAALQRRCRFGDRILLVFQPGLEFIAGFFGCLYAGLIAVPALPPHPARLNRVLPKLKGMTRDAEPTVLLTTSKLLEHKPKIVAEAPALDQMSWIATDQLDGERAEDWKPPQIDGERLAFIQYTSGSTSEPKGVMVSHANLLHNSAYLHHSFSQSPENVLVSWLPPFHDMGLIFGVLQPLFGDFPAYLMSPASFIQRPLAWLQAISQFKATQSVSPNFGYELCVRKVRPEQKKDLDLSGWQVAVNGAEPVRQETIERFVEAFEPCGFRREAFYPAYGLAEATLKVTGDRRAPQYVSCVVKASALEKHRLVLVDDETPLSESRVIIGSGHSEMGVVTSIVNPETMERCAPDEVGEIWVRGPSIAQGYWNNPVKTEETFQAYIRGEGEGPYLRTGDLGFIRNGELFVTGRLKDLIIIGGANHYPQDIELTVEKSHPCLRPSFSAAFSIDEAGEERLVVAAEVERGFSPASLQPGREPVAAKPRSKTWIDPQEIITAICRSIAEAHDLNVFRVVLIKTGTIPKTSSGKIQRQACRKLFLQGELELWMSSSREGDKK